MICLGVRLFLIPAALKTRGVNKCSRVANIYLDNIKEALETLRLPELAKTQ